MMAEENQSPSKRLVELSQKENLTPKEEVELEELKNQLFFDSSGENLDDIDELSDDDALDYLTDVTQD